MITNTLSSVHAAIVAATGTLTVDIPNPGPIAPPGSNGLVTIIGWASWIIFGIAVIAIFVVAGRMMLESGRGRGGGEAATGLVWVLAGVILAAVASGVIGTIVVASS